MPSSSASQVPSITAQSQSQGQSQSQQPQVVQPPPQPRSRPNSRTSASPSAATAAHTLIPEEQSSTTGKKSSRPRKSSAASQSGIVIAVTGVDMESQSLSLTGNFLSFTSTMSLFITYRTRNLENIVVILQNISSN